MSLRVTRQYADTLIDGSGGQARVTRQYVEAVAEGGAGKARVSRQYVEVLTAALEVSVSDTLSLIDVAVGTTLDNIVGVGENTLAIMDTAVGELLRQRSVEDTLAIVDQAVATRHAAGVASNTLSLAQDVQTNIKQVEVVDTLNLQQDTSTIGPTYLAVNHSLGLTDSAEAHLAVINLSVVDVLALSDSVGRVIEVEASNTLTLTDESVRRVTAEDTLVLVQTVVVGKSAPTSNTISLVQTANAAGIYRRTGTNTLALAQAVTYEIDNNCIEKNYTPFVGAGSGEYTPPSTTTPTLSSDTLTLTYPYVSPTTTLILRNPAFSNKDRLIFNRINRVTRGGTLIVFADPQWPKQQRLTLQLDALRPQQILDLIDFLEESLGKEIGLLDWEGRQWKGLILNPDTDLVQPAREDRSVVIDFEGELV